MHGWYNGEPEFYAALSDSTPPPPGVELRDPDALTPAEKDMCRRIGVSEQDFARVRAETINKFEELQQ